jgi:hypothetical protein
MFDCDDLLIFSISVLVFGLIKLKCSKKSKLFLEKDSTYNSLIGNTRLIKLETISALIGCDIFAKARISYVMKLNNVVTVF